MSQAGPLFYAACGARDRVDAFAATLSAFVAPGATCDVWIDLLERGHLARDAISIADAIAEFRAAYGAGVRMAAGVRATLGWGRTIEFGVHCHDAAFEQRYPRAEPMGATISDMREVLVWNAKLPIPPGGRSTAAEAALVAMQAQRETEDIFLGLCAPDEQSRVVTGAYTLEGDWGAPLEAAASYHGDAQVARDLALSWLYLHDGYTVARGAGLSFDALVARVRAAPVGAQVTVAVDVHHVKEHERKDRDAGVRGKPPTRPDVVRDGSRARLPGDADLTREQVLAALETPMAALRDALEAAAVPDDEWRAAEPAALEAIDAMKQGAPTYEVNVHTGRHTRWIELHAPYHVRRLPNGGVMLATHPYRILWPLWADALTLLGIREAS